MKLLALETSTHMLSVALSIDDSLIERAEFCVNGGSDRLLPWVQQVLAEAGVSLQQLDAIAFGAGPGSFTGLRMACGVAQGLAYGANLPVIPIVTLAALALAQGPGRMLSCLDARMNEVYCAAYEVNGDKVEEVLAPLVCPPELLPLPPGREWMGCGDGFASYADTLAVRLGDALLSIDPQVPALAPAVVRLAARQLRQSRGALPPAQAVPFYVRNKVALTTQERLARGGSK
ncbi:putative Inactive homolog of metal-dependent proteases, molecular chaperone [Georgfuchsia toluolica]|uniref:Inactive homolog of metal-dependent proteases, molecular chaperone n=1 Tax=Georgfuchsia toluolica TaxID=424218 RepID=A0A916J1H9_9PROT|nr:tRNA (adenosine(37)-N6)-threonylcarbamoyltransferase complex dimerization subunit type 1 TsaB [Georgfuchsia toluolica]CAG4882860.1 putative Inactive homolog of metal-dependent proteases, molecular chaperone [Georgfuchsia toluolica]